MFGFGIDNKIKNSFRKVRDDLTRVSSWINFFYKKTQIYDDTLIKLKEEFENYKTSHNNHLEEFNKYKTETKQNQEQRLSYYESEIEKLNNSIDELIELISMLKDNFNKNISEKDIEINYLRKLVLNYSKKLDDISNEIEENKNNIKENKKLIENNEDNYNNSKNIKKEIEDLKNKKEIKSNHNNEELEISSQIYNSNLFQNLKEKLTPAEKRIIALLINLDHPMDYSSIAKELSISPITVRRHISSIIKAGFPIKILKNDLNRNVVLINEEAKKEIIKN